LRSGKEKTEDSSASKPSYYNLRKETKEFVMPPANPVFATDRQRLARAGQRPKLPLTTPTSDKHHLAANKQPVPKALVVTQNTLLVRGTNGSQWRITFGDGSQVSTVDLTHYRFYHDIGHRHIELTGLLPDCIGLDFNASGAFGPASGVGGVNVLWHTRGEQEWYKPEVHFYYGLAGSTGWAVSKVAPVKEALSASGGISLFLAWATAFDRNGRPQPAPNAWVANGFNWTGTFWSVGISVPTPWGWNLAGSYFSSDANQVRHLINHKKFAANTIAWTGVSLGFTVGLPKAAKIDQKLFEITKLVLDKSSFSLSKTEYLMVFGNGRDYNDFLPGRPSISGWNGFTAGNGLFDWHLGVDQNNFPH
jgi:hypothetical protein